MRFKAASWSHSALCSNARASRGQSALAASDSTAMSTSTERMSGASSSAPPKARRVPVCCTASCTHWRMSAAEPMTQSRRVWTTISTIVRMPRPGRPSMTPHAFEYSTSLDAFDRSPILSLSRITRRPALRVPSGSHRGTKKHETPSSPVCARVRNASDMGALVNHLCPTSVYCWPGPLRPACTGVATVVFALTSEPPCFSVIDIPMVAPTFELTGTSRGS
mmetsp:Transcript_16506/g.42350  ORF Transcript_16506/g.42350 Transcript_16506/m.42350 type:complete len:221 (+) Transcript_16506:788-1450(+)